MSAASGSVCLAAILVLLAGCGGSEGAGRGGLADTSEVGANLLSGRDLIGSTLPVEGAEASQAPPGTATPRTPNGGAENIDITLLGHDSGSPEAPIKIVEFSDFGCSYCRRFHLESYPVIEEEYIRTGKVEWKYIPMILGLFGPNAEMAAEAGQCALQQGRFPNFRDRLFSSQSEWKQADDPSRFLKEYAEEEGLDVARWGECMSEHQGRERVETGTRLSAQSGVRGTPTFFILGAGIIPGAIPLDLFKQVLDTLYAEALGPGNR